MKILDHLIYRITLVSGMIGTYMIFALMIIILVDIGGRIFFQAPLAGTPEIVKNSIVIIVFLQLAYTMRRNRHVRSSLVLNKLHPKIKTIIEVISSLLGAFIFLSLIMTSWGFMITSFIAKEFEMAGSLKIPTYPVRMSIVIGSFLMFVECLRIIMMKTKELRNL